MSEELENAPIMEPATTPQEEHATAEVAQEINEPANDAMFEKEQAVKKEPKPKKQFKSAYPDPAEFDWNAFGKNSEIYTTNERNELENQYEKTMKSINDHEVLSGTVVGITSREVIVNIGFKSDGMIPRSEVRYNKELKIGDVLKVYVENQEDSTGQLLLSHKKARVLESWDRVNEAHD
ncbi:MAG: S1 RNA-binding domain-containing protein, partial [Bacteroidales bacterium]|nr:S1 RNA-binding domain-containing protein [Bacteroidales bacterium]